MKKLVTFASDIRLNALVCSSVAVLLTACGGNTPDSMGAAQTQTAAVAYNSATTASDASAATAPAVADTATTPADTGAAPAAAQAPATGFDLSGYGAGELSAAGDATANPQASTTQASANAPTRLLAMSVAVAASTSPQDQITQLYQSLLGRAPDAGGLAYWTAALNNGISLDAITAAFKASPEYIKRQSSTTTTPPASPAPAASTIGVPATTYNYYVSPTGSDSNGGTKSAPFKTLARAAQAAKANTTVWVAPGTYTGGIKTTASGTASGRIYWVSTTKWGAKIVPGSTANVWDNRGNYVSIVGFDIDGSSKPAVTHGIYMGGSYDEVRANHVHHIANGATCTSGGGEAIGTDSYYNGVWSDVIGNTVHDIGPKSCKFIQGIYVSTSGTVKNNVVYRVGEAAIHLWHDANHVTITNNTVASSHYGILVGGGDFYHSSTGDDYTVVNNNILIDNGYGIEEEGKTGTHNSYSNNLVYQNGTNISLRNGLTAKNTVTSNPLFVSYSKTMTTPNFHLSSSSPAIGRGTATGALATDIDGKPRNASTGYDIGAYQH
jgi:hypothetical protein